MCTSVLQCTKIEGIRLLDCYGLGISNSNQLQTSQNWLEFLDSHFNQINSLNLSRLLILFLNLGATDARDNSQRTKIAANLAFKLVTYLIFLKFSNQFLAFRVFTGIVKHNIYKDSFGLNADGSIPKICESIFLRQRVYVHRTKSESKFEVPFTVNKSSKHGSICIALLSKPFKVDLTICIDVSPNPGPKTSERNNFGTENLTTVGASSRLAAITMMTHKPSFFRSLRFSQSAKYIDENTFPRNPETVSRPS